MIEGAPMKKTHFSNHKTIAQREIIAQNVLEHFLDGHKAHWIIMVLIILNAVILGLQTSETAVASFGPILDRMTHTIIWIFAFEMVLRVFAGGLRFFRKPLDLLDFVAIALSLILNQPGFSILRLIRALRVFLLHDLSPHMRHILSGMRHALPGVIHVIGVMLVLFYISSIISVALFRDPQLPYFQSMGTAMMTLFQVLTGDNWSIVFLAVQKIYPQAWIFFFTFYVVMVFVVLNFFIGVVVGALQTADATTAKFNAAARDEGVHKHLKKIEGDILKLQRLLENKESKKKE
jgi:voltage-gated sodium channel